MSGNSTVFINETIIYKVIYPILTNKRTLDIKFVLKFEKRHREDRRGAYVERHKTKECVRKRRKERMVGRGKTETTQSKRVHKKGRGA